jgi:hypothetical protein
MLLIKYLCTIKFGVNSSIRNAVCKLEELNLLICLLLKKFDFVLFTKNNSFNFRTVV